MWFALGFVTLIVSVGYQWWSRWHRGWRGAEEHLGGIPCETKLRSFKGVVYGLTVGIDAPETFRFELKRERAWDRFFKWTGLTVEHQFGHAGFDPLVFVSSNDQHLLGIFEGNTPLLHAVQRLFAPRSDHNWIKRVRCANGKLWMDIGTSELNGKSSQKATREAAAALLPLLQVLRKALDASMSEERQTVRDRYLLPTVAILALSSGLAINGVVSWTRSLLASPEFMLDAQPLKLCAWALAAGIVGALAIASLFFLRGSARVHMVLMEIALVGTFGAVTTASSGLRDANIDFDESLPIQIERRLIGKTIHERTSKFGTKSTTYSLKYRLWTGSGEERGTPVSASTYREASIGDTLQFEQYAGYFGWRWAKFKAWKPASALPSRST